MRPTRLLILGLVLLVAALEAAEQDLHFKLSIINASPKTMGTKYSGGSCSEISLEMEFLWQNFFSSKSGPRHPKNGTKLKFNKKSLRKHAPKFQFQVRNSWVRYITFSVYQAFSCLTKCVILLLDILETWF